MPAATLTRSPSCEIRIPNNNVPTTSKCSTSGRLTATPTSCKQPAAAHKPPTLTSLPARLARLLSFKPQVLFHAQPPSFIDSPSCSHINSASCNLGMMDCVAEATTEATVAEPQQPLESDSSFPHLPAGSEFISAGVQPHSGVILSNGSTASSISTASSSMILLTTHEEDLPTEDSTAPSCSYPTSEGTAPAPCTGSWAMDPHPTSPRPSPPALALPLTKPRATQCPLPRSISSAGSSTATHSTISSAGSSTATHSTISSAGSSTVTHSTTSSARTSDSSASAAEPELCLPATHPSTLHHASTSGRMSEPSSGAAERALLAGHGTPQSPRICMYITELGCAELTASSWIHHSRTPSSLSSTAAAAPAPAPTSPLSCTGAPVPDSPHCLAAPAPAQVAAETAPQAAAAAVVDAAADEASASGQAFKPASAPGMGHGFAKHPTLNLPGGRRASCSDCPQAFDPAMGDLALLDSPLVQSLMLSTL